jgi:hypothetical protein
MVPATQKHEKLPSKINLKVVTWNMLTLHISRTHSHLMAVMLGYGTDLIAVQEVRWIGECTYLKISTVQCSEAVIINNNILERGSLSADT